MSRRFLSDSDSEAIAAAIAKAELSTSGEIVFALTDASGQYRKAAYQGAILGMAGTTALYVAIPVPHRIDLLLGIQLVSFLLSFALFTTTRMRLWMVSTEELEARVRETALAEFYSSGLFKTRESNGVLIFLSLLEHRVIVLGDSAVDAKLGSAHWDTVRDRIIQGIRERKPREGIIDAVEMCGKALADHFPRRPDDLNELSDRVIQRKSTPDTT